MNCIKKATVPIFSMKLAGIAMTKGFVLLSMERNYNGSGKNVFYFNDSPELRNLMIEYKASRKG